MATTRIVLNRATVIRGTVYSNFALSSGHGSESQAMTPWSCAGAFSNLTIERNAALGAGRTRTTTLRKSATTSLSATALQAAIFDGGPASDSDITNVISIAAGNFLSWEIACDSFVGGTDDLTHSVDFTATNARESGWSWSSSDSGNSASTRYSPFFQGDTNLLTTSTTGMIGDVIAVAGELTRYDVLLSAAPGAGASGKAYRFTLMRSTDGGATYTLLDGSGGTPDTRLTILETAVTGAWTGTCAMSVGDIYIVKIEPISSPTAAAVAMSSCFEHGDDNAINFFCTPQNSPTSGSSTTYHSNTPNLAWTSTESTLKVQAGVTPFILKNLIVAQATDPAGSCTYTQRKNEATPTGAATVALTGTTRSGSGAGSLIEYATGDYFSLMCVTSSGNTASTSYAFQQMLVIPPILKVTQLAVFVFTDEDADEDIPEIADPCSGGGTMPTGSNPSAGTSLSTATSPEFYIEIDLGGASPSTLQIAKGPVTTSAGVTEPIVTSWSDLTRAAVDPAGRHQTAWFEVTVFDPQAILRGPMDDVWSGASSSDALVERNARFYGRASSGSTAQLLFQGLIRSAEIDDLSVKLSIEDALSVKTLSIFSDEMLVPKQLVTSALTDDTPLEEMLDKAIPLAYGSLSDEVDGDDANGVVPLHFVKTVDGKDVFLGCLGAVKNIQSVFGADFQSDTIEPTNRMKFGDTAWGDWAWAPHKPNWSDINDDPWYEVNGRKFTAVLLDHEHVVARLAREKRIPLSMNICGYEDVGDGSGTMIDSLERQFLHFLVNFVWGDYDGSGNWATSIPSLGSYSAIDTASFESCKEAGEDMLEDGILGAFLIGYDLKQRTALDIAAQFCRSGGFEYAINQYGQITLFRLNTTEDASAITARTALEHVIQGSLKITPSREQQVDLVPYVYGRKYLATMADLAPEEGARLPPSSYQSQWTSGLQTYNTGTGGTKRADVQEYDMVRDATIAAFIAEQYGDLFKRPRLVAEWMERLGATGLEIGTVQKLTHFKATGAGGWTDRRVQIRKSVLKPDARNVLVQARDVDDLL
jgi:hypothetical protein